MARQVAHSPREGSHFAEFSQDGIGPIISYNLADVTTTSSLLLKLVHFVQ